ncbi:hypothetical protein Csac_2150 [Caldicellulosiruptor saccharolyticus DSM 8903]|uniref:Uncharacterized protein n=1 Tax=Caldicellulosiruptor saccharolyticus (strain ATCC 43494 / DSM 8903 / Tp8T 6331) TaxID=351627 RepID=A4XLE7_CALS8|nr:hypothetical protein [Caldicellulosiruptor saccharolyticus]ABP67732.1 hypothetical protein Csac_2150 [Caldicellulosiruptor saccharolyticus DSM 8903]
MNEINNYITLYRQNLINEILNLIDNSNQQITGEIIKVNGDNLILNINSQTIMAKNLSSFSFKEGDKVWLSSPKYQDGKLTFKIVELLPQNTRTNSDVNSNDNLSNITFAKSQNSDVERDISNKIENLIRFTKPESFLFIKEDKIPSSLLEFAKRNKVFLGTITIEKEGESEKLIIKVGEKTFEIENELNTFYLQGKIKEGKIFSGDNNLFLFVFDKEKGLILIPKETVVNKEFKDIILSIFSNNRIEPKEEKDFLAILSLILAKRPITKDEFMMERAQLNKFLDSLNKVFANKRQGQDLDKENLIINTKEGFFLFKLLSRDDKAFEQKVVQILNDLRFNQKENIQFDFGSFYLNIFNFKLNINEKPFELQFFVNRKKVTNMKVNSVMIRINTQNLGCMGVYVKKISQNTFRAMIASDRLFTLKLIESKANELIAALKERGYKLEIDYKMEDTSTTNVILDFLMCEAPIQKIDMKV